MDFTVLDVDLGLGCWSVDAAVPAFTKICGAAGHSLPQTLCHSQCYRVQGLLPHRCGISCALSKLRSVTVVLLRIGLFQVKRPLFLPCLGVSRRDKHILLPLITDVAIEQGLCSVNHVLLQIGLA